MKEYSDNRATFISEAVDELSDNSILDYAKDRLPATFEKIIARLREDLTEVFIYEDTLPTGKQGPDEY